MMRCPSVKASLPPISTVTPYFRPRAEATMGRAFKRVVWPMAKSFREADRLHVDLVVWPLDGLGRRVYTPQGTLPSEPASGLADRQGFFVRFRRRSLLD